MRKLMPILLSFLAWMAVAPQTHAEQLAVGDVMEPYTLPDQFDKVHTLAESILLDAKHQVTAIEYVEKPEELEALLP